MCEPTTLAIGSMAMTAASTGASVLGQMGAQGAAAGQAARSQAQEVYNGQLRAQQQAAQGRYEEETAVQNITLAERRADQARSYGAIAKAGATDALARGEVEATAISRDVTRRTDQTAGTQRAILAAQGTDLSGSPTEILGDTAASGAYDRLTGMANARSNAARAAYGYELQAYESGTLGVYNAELDKTRALNDRDMARLKSTTARPGSTSVDYTPSYAGAGASALAGASNLAEKWWKFQQNDPSGGVFASSPSSVMTDYAALPTATRNPGFESLIS